MEDGPTLVATLRYNLEREGYRVVTAADGEAALSVVRTKRPDLIILDLMLPKLDGFEVCRITEGDAVVGIVRVARPSAAVDAALSDITRSVLIAVAVTAGAAALLSLAIGATVMVPLNRLARAARAIVLGRLGERIHPRPSGEVGQLADAFNQMASSLEQLMAEASQERNRLVAALNSSVDAVLAVDPDGRIAFVNVGAERLFLRRQDELVGNPFSWVMPNEQVLDALRSSREDGQRHSTLIERPNRRYLQVITTPILGGGEWAGLIVIHDLTDVKRTEQIRRDFVANVSHELRTPLASIKSVIETLQGGASQDKQTARDFVAQADARGGPHRPGRGGAVARVRALLQGRPRPHRRGDRPRARYRQAHRGGARRLRGGRERGRAGSTFSFSIPAASLPLQR